MPRDDFSQYVKQTLAARVGHQCSNPDCCATTSGPQIDSAKALNLGVAAHITAATEGGPRFDPVLSSELRSGIDNAVWLCQNCAKLIDNDPQRFPRELLSAWRMIAEHRALNAIGRTASPAPSIQDKFVSLDYVEAAGITPRLRSDGYAVRWIRADEEALDIDVEGWEIVEQTTPTGERIRFKVKDSICEYLILVKKEEIMMPRDIRPTS